MKTRIIVMTGGTSGFGAITADYLLKTAGTKLILGTRGKQTAGAINIPLDLQSLASTQQFATQIIQKIGGEQIDALVLNAGVSFSDLSDRSAEGFETTFAINHLAHQLLLCTLIPHLDSHARIILTTSGTHNPAEQTRIAPPKHANARWLAYPEQDPTLDEKEEVNAGRAYASSKLCNILTARYVNRLAEAPNNNWQAIAYDPGATPGTGLSQNRGVVMRLFWQLLAIPVLRKRLLPKSNSREDAGMMLAKITLGEIACPVDKVYVALRNGTITFPEPSEMALDDGLMERLWQESKQLLEEGPAK